MDVMKDEAEVANREQDLTIAKRRWSSRNC
jgi:hypothetical protein